MFRIISLGILLSFALQAELTPDQKASDLRSIADRLAKMYAPAEWKRVAFKKDPLEIGPWVEKARQTANDLAYYEVVVEYIASLQDGHTYYILPSTFRATLGFGVDMYEGKVVIDSIDRTRLSEADFAAKIGDELLKIDGQAVGDWMAATSRLLGEGSPGTLRRTVAGFLTVRDQALLPRAVELGDTATVEIMQEGGTTASYTIPWRKTGYPVRTLPGIPAVKQAAAAAAASEETFEAKRTRARRDNWKTRDKDWVLGVGSKNMLFGGGDAFVKRVGDAASDRFTSGIFTKGERKIGYVRVPQFNFSSVFTALANELAALDGMTEGLILDLMRNPGGSACGAQALVARVTGDPFRVFRAQHRITFGDVLSAWFYLDDARRFGDADDVAEAELLVREYEAALNEGRALTNPLPVCGSKETEEPFRNAAGELGGYTKPVVLLVDEFSASASELVASSLKDNGRALVVGKRTAGAGGSVIDAEYGTLSEGQGAITWALGVRPVEIDTGGEYPVGPYVENIAVRPDKELDLMTVDNLKNNGAAFREALLTLADEFIQSRK